MRPCLTSTWKGCDTGLCGGIPNRISSRPASEAIHDSEDVAEVLGEAGGDARVVNCVSA